MFERIADRPDYIREKVGADYLITSMNRLAWSKDGKVLPSEQKEVHPTLVDLDKDKERKQLMKEVWNNKALDSDFLELSLHQFVMRNAQKINIGNIEILCKPVFDDD